MTREWRNGREREGEREREREGGNGERKWINYYREKDKWSDFRNVQLSVMLGGHLSGSVENISTLLKRIHH